MRINLTDFVKDARKITQEDLPEEVKKLRHAVTDDLYEEQVSLSPVLTGRLKKGWEKRKASGPWAVDRTGNKEFYSRFVNDGTSKRRPVRMRERAVAKVLTKYGGTSE